MRECGEGARNQECPPVPCPFRIRWRDSKGGGFLEKEVNSIKMVEMVEVEKLILKQRKEVV